MDCWATSTMQILQLPNVRKLSRRPWQAARGKVGAAKHARATAACLQSTKRRSPTLLGCGPRTRSKMARELETGSRNHTPCIRRDSR